jgi:hypothetical protein
VAEAVNDELHDLTNVRIIFNDDYLEGFRRRTGRVCRYSHCDFSLGGPT